VPFGNAMIVGSLGGAFFLMLAGAGAALSAGSRLRRSGNPAAAATRVIRHGLLIFGLAFLFRLQAWILGWFPSPRDLLRVDMLNIMGPSIVATGLLWRLAGTIRGRLLVFAAATIATACTTPIVRAMPLGFLPDAVEGYVVPVRGLSNFVFFPWMGFVFAGALVGLLIEANARRPGERRLYLWFGSAGAMLAGGGYLASWLPSPFEGTTFWTSSPAFFFIRVGVVVLSVAAAHTWTTRVRRPARWSPILQLGRTSLFIYWIHVELIYGVISRPLQRALSLREAWIAFAAFTALMLICSVGKERLAERRRSRQDDTAAIAKQPVP
jgi:uncharacterized membrane protein